MPAIRSAAAQRDPSSAGAEEQEDEEGSVGWALRVSSEELNRLLMLVERVRGEESVRGVWGACCSLSVSDGAVEL